MRGFSLLELLLASVILALALGIVLEGMASGLRTESRVERECFARRLASDRLDRAAASYVQAVRSPSPEATRSTWNLAQPGASGTSFWRTVEYRWRVDMDEPEEPALVRLSCVVAWTDHGRERTVRLDRLVAQSGGAPSP